MYIDDCNNLQQLNIYFQCDNIQVWEVWDFHGAVIEGLSDYCLSFETLGPTCWATQYLIPEDRNHKRSSQGSQIEFEGIEFRN
jgi:hypothetical protein